ncbi:MAG: metal-dependent hydrolase [Phenylobacterium sp.]|uniref:metal-dependent hydrolase n=1 Tax=Phenylobacterium sp. TaxID=1871053 RepID=UPI00391DD4CA
MFVGHYAAAVAAKAAEPRAPLWTYVIAAQLVDIGWGGLVMAGVEKVRIDPTLPGSALDLYHMPWTHSLPAALAWSLAGALLARHALRLSWRPAVFVGLVVFSHWLLDLLVHRPDLELWFGGPKAGFGLWNYPVPEQAVEIGLLGLGAAAWAWVRGRAGRSLWPVLVFLAALVAVQIVAMLMPGGGDMVGLGATAIAVYLVLAALAWALDRPGGTA